MTDYPNDQTNPAAAIPVYIGDTPGASVANLTTTGNHLVKTGAGAFLGLSVNTVGTTSTAKVYDGLTAGGTLLGTISTVAIGGPTVPAGGWPFATGLFIVTAGGAPADLTVLYR